MADITEQIVREAPEIEAYKIGLLQSAKGLADTPVNIPGMQVAGFSPDQIAAFEQARSGIGSYQPYLYAGAQNLGQGAGLLQQGAGILQGADTRPQFGSAQQAMGRGMASTAQLGDISGQVSPGYGMLREGQSMSNLAAQQAAGVNYQPGYDEAVVGTRQAQGAARGASAADYRGAQDLMGQGIGQLLGGAGQYDPRSVAAFMNPYQQQVVDATMQEINRQRDLTAQQLSAQAVRAGAYGGSRQGVQQAELERNTAQLRNQAIANLMSQGYTQAQAQSQASFEEQQRRQQLAGQGIGQQAALSGQLATQQTQLGQASAALQGQLAGQQGSLAGQQGQLGFQRAGLTGQLAGQQAQFAGQQGALAGQQAGIIGQQAGLYGNIGQGIGNLAGQEFGVGQQIATGVGQMGSALGNLGVQQGAMGQTAQQLGQQDVNLLYNIGQQQQGLNQATLDAQRNTELQQAYEPYQRLAFLSDIYKGAPSSQQSITAATAPVPSTFQQAVGTGIAGLAAGTAAKKAGLF